MPRCGECKTYYSEADGGCEACSEAWLAEQDEKKALAEQAEQDRLQPDPREGFFGVESLRAATMERSAVRNISFSLTTKSFIEGRKTVTRRLAWLGLRPGTRLMAVEKAMGLKPGEKVKPLGLIEVVDVRREPLSAITSEDVLAEGVEGVTTPEEFVAGFCKAMRCKPEATVTRIEFRRVS